MEEDKKIAAAKSAVIQYIETEEATGSPYSGHLVSATLARQAHWGMSGRQAQMQMRAMMGMRAFDRRRPAPP